MGLAYGVAIVEASDVGAITHESGLVNVDDDASNAELTNSMAEATNELMRRIRSRGIDPTTIDADTQTELMAAAAYYTCFLLFAAQNQADEENRAKTDSYKKRFLEQLDIVVIRTTAGDALTNDPRGGPMVANVNSTWVIGGRNTVTPNGIPDQIWITKNQPTPTREPGT